MVSQLLLSTDYMIYIFLFSKFFYTNCLGIKYVVENFLKNILKDTLKKCNKRYILYTHNVFRNDNVRAYVEIQFHSFTTFKLQNKP